MCVRLSMFKIRKGQNQESKKDRRRISKNLEIWTRADVEVKQFQMDITRGNEISEISLIYRRQRNFQVCRSLPRS